MLVVIYTVYCILYVINSVFSIWLYVFMFLVLKFWRRIHPHISTIYCQVNVLGYFTSCMKK